MVLKYILIIYLQQNNFQNNIDKIKILTVLESWQVSYQEKTKVGPKLKAFSPFYVFTSWKNS